MSRAACPGCTDGATVGPLCPTHAHEVDRIAERALAHLRASLREVAEAMAVEPVAAVRYSECPRCDGHGDVPTGRYDQHNPTGLEECPRCDGHGEVIADLARLDAIDGALTLWADRLDGDLSLDQRLPSEHGYEVAS